MAWRTTARTRRKILISTQARADLRAHAEALRQTYSSAKLRPVGTTEHWPFRGTKLRPYQLGDARADFETFSYTVGRAVVAALHHRQRELRSK